MPDIEKIIKAIDTFLEKNHQEITTPVEINTYLEKLGLLNDNKNRKGLPIRRILRKKTLIPHAYQIGNKWQIPHSSKNSNNTQPITKPKKEKAVKKRNSSEHKLIQIGDLIVRLLEKKYGKKATCLYENKPDWLLSYPSKEFINNRTELSKLYSKLTDNKFTLKEKIKELTDKKIKQRQSFDIWIGKPYNFAVEFDEKQHFNQYRKITLDYYQNVKIKFPLDYYKTLNTNIIIKPGKSGFTRLKSNDPLFPEMLKGEKQDNRIRQRAFRDFLKDLLPIENGFNPTLRIPYHITNFKINNFDEIDIKNVEKYIIENELI